MYNIYLKYLNAFIAVYSCIFLQGLISYSNRYFDSTKYKRSRRKKKITFKTYKAEQITKRIFRIVISYHPSVWGHPSVKCGTPGTWIDIIVYIIL